LRPSQRGGFLPGIFPCAEYKELTPGYLKFFEKRMAEKGVWALAVEERVRKKFGSGRKGSEKGKYTVREIMLKSIHCCAGISCFIVMLGLMGERG
jgi:hypothetical protein